MTDADAATLIRLAATLALLWSFAVFLWRRHAVEKFRQEVFALRDELFDLAASMPDSQISFISPAYRAFRSEMNSLIRFAHQISFFRAMLFNAMRLVFLPNVPTYRIVRKSVVSILAIEDPRLRTKVALMVRTLNWNIVKLCIKTSPLLMVVGAYIVVRVSLPICCDALRRRKAVTRQLTPAPVMNAALIPSRIRVRKATTQRMRFTHEPVWAESRQCADAEMGELVHC